MMGFRFPVSGFRLWLAGVILVAAPMLRAGEEPAFRYDMAKTQSYLLGTKAPKSAGVAAELRQELATVVAEILDGPWAPLYSDYSAAQAGGVGPAEWCFTRPGELLLALAEAEPHLSNEQREQAKTLLNGVLKDAPPTKRVHFDLSKGGKERNIRRVPVKPNLWTSREDGERLMFGEAYSVWACAQAFDQWDEAKVCFEDLKKIRAELEKRGDFAPVYKNEHDGVLTAALAADAAYRFRVYKALICGCQDNYWDHVAREAQERMEKGKPVFFYVRILTGLIGHRRLAMHFGDDTETKWAADTFNKVAAMTLSHQAAPFLWSDHYLIPEVARMLRDHAGAWLDELKQTPNVGDQPAYDWNRKLVPGAVDKVALNPFTHLYAWGGQGEGIRPRTVLAAFLVNAWLFNASPEQIAEARDIPWCKADLYHVRKLVAALRAGN